MIIVECYKDRQLMFRMGFIPDQVEHGYHKSGVLRRVGKSMRAVGIIDEDPQANQPEYLKKYKENRVIGKISLLIRKDDDGKRTIRRAIQISPYFEAWLYERAKQNKLSPEDFGLPDDPEVLHNRSLRTGRNMANFLRFLSALNRARDSEIETIKQWISEAIAE
jgi:hypothetical protein